MSIHYQDDKTTIHHGDCLEVMADMPADSVDAIVTDPPYNLSSGKKRDLKCIRQAVTEILLPDDDNGNAQSVESSNLSVPSPLGSFLSGEGRPTGVHAGISVPEGAVDLQGAAVAQHEVNARDEPATIATDEVLTSEGDAEPGQFVGNFILQLADSIDAPFCDGTCSCFTEPSAGVIAVAVVAPSFASGDGSSVGLVVEGNDVVWGGDNAGREPKSATGVHASGRTEDRFMLRLDLRGGTGELVPAGGALDGLPLFTLVTTEAVGAGAGAGRLSPMAKPYRVGLIDGSTGGTFTLYHVAHIKHSTTGGFMGKEWDGWDNPASFQRWATAWAREAMRVLKPGGHLLAFGGTRTWHRLAVAIEDAGFEMRDSIAWLYGAGFPKSLNVSKAIDRIAGAEREVVGIGGKSGKARNSMAGDFAGEWDTTAPATPEAQQWEGWGTALKPAFEPVVMARKPLIGTVAANVLEHGTGAINIDGCRIATEDNLNGGGYSDTTTTGTFLLGGAGSVDELRALAAAGEKTPNGETATLVLARAETAKDRVGEFVQPSGRWPANVVLDESQAEALDKQSGVSKPKPQRTGRMGGDRDGLVMGRGGDAVGTWPADPGGGASRFMYVSKASKRERPNVDGTAHPTVKPLSLMQWLVRMVTPPGGTVLDPFAGSGTTIEAALTEGFNSIGIELTDEYLPLIQHRIERSTQQAFNI